MKLSRRMSWFLSAFGVWSVVVWTTFVKNLWKDASGLAFRHGDHGQPTAYFWIHLTLAVVSFGLGVAIGVLGVRGLRATRRGRRAVRWRTAPRWRAPGPRAPRWRASRPADRQRPRRSLPCGLDCVPADRRQHEVLDEGLGVAHQR